jgi:heme-based aerotactic transducer
MTAYGREVNLSVDGSVQSSLSLRETAVTGGRQITDLEALMASLNDKFVRMEQVLRQWNDFSGRIGEISKVVMEIASQTKLLSLNAAIEAARAGENGLGFSVVAREVRKLSEETTRSIAGISQVIEDSMRQAREAAASVDEVKRFVAEGEEKSSATRDAFGEIVSAIDQSMGQVRGAEQKMHELLHVIHEIGDAARKVADSADHLHQTANSL